jgi:hypothetical protein
MTIECYIAECKYHSTHDEGPDEGPFCYREHCAWSTAQLESKAYLNPPTYAEVEPETQLYCGEMRGDHDDNEHGIIMQGQVEATSLMDALERTLGIWPFPTPPRAISVHLHVSDDDEEEECDAKVHGA